jgi:hypothetical protein
MIHQVMITELDELMPLLADQEYRPDLKRNRTSYVYRGIPDTSFKMQTSLRRNCKELSTQLEPSILRNFAKYAVIDDPTIQHSVWRQMIVGQHYSLPTRLLDWTQSALIALHFAVTEEDLDRMNDHDCMVWRIDMREMAGLLPQKYQQVLQKTQGSVFSVEMMNQITNNLEEYDKDMGSSAMVVVEPPSIDARIVNQYSFFSLVPSQMIDIEGFLDSRTDNTTQYIIDKSLRWRIRDMLDQLNISERIVYPGLSGLSKWIARHYFVKEGN